MANRTVVLDRVRVAHAKYGPSADTVWVYVSYRLSREAYEEARRAGCAQWRDCQANPDQARCKTYNDHERN